MNHLKSLFTVAVVITGIGVVVPAQAAQPESHLSFKNALQFAVNLWQEGPELHFHNNTSSMLHVTYLARLTTGSFESHEIYLAPGGSEVDYVGPLLKGGTIVSVR